jgi:hypothetical protein
MAIGCSMLHVPHALDHRGADPDGALGLVRLNTVA